MSISILALVSSIGILVDRCQFLCLLRFQARSWVLLCRVGSCRVSCLCVHWPFPPLLLAWVSRHCVWGLGVMLSLWSFSQGPCVLRCWLCPQLFGSLCALVLPAAGPFGAFVCWGRCELWARHLLFPALLLTGHGFAVLATWFSGVHPGKCDSSAYCWRWV